MPRILNRLVLGAALATTSLLFFGSFAFAAEGWWMVGDSLIGQTPTNNDPNDSVLDHYAASATGRLYVVYRDVLNNSWATVRTFVNGTWVQVGPAWFWSGVIADPRVAVSSTGVIYVAYRDEANGKSLAVKKYDGSSWADLWSSAFAGTRINQYVSFALSPQGVPYAAISDSNAGSRVKVMRYTGGSWHAVGGTRDSSGALGGDYISRADAYWPYLAFDPAGSAYVAYVDCWYGCKGTVDKLGSDDQWSNVGGQGFTAGGLDYLSMVVPSNGRPVIAYMDNSASANHRASAMRFDGTNWVQMGSGYISQGEAPHSHLFASPAGTVYFQTSDGGSSYGYSTRVFSFDGTNWNQLGNTVPSGATGEGGGFVDPFGNIYVNGIATIGSVVSTRLYSYSDKDVSGGSSLGAPAFNGTGTGIALKWNLGFDTSGNAYAAYVDYSASRNTTVMKYDGSSWSALGGAGAIPTATGTTYFASVLVVSPANQRPYLAYLDTAESRLRVSAWNGSAWTAVWSPLVSGYAAAQQSMAIATDGTPYVAYREVSSPNKVYVQKFDGTSWSVVGGAAVSAGDGRQPAIAIAPDGTLYVAYPDATNNYALTVRKWNGSSWSTVGTPGMGTRTGNTSFTVPAITIDSAGNPYILYSDYSSATGFPFGYVAKFDGTSWANVGGSFGRLNIQWFLGTGPDGTIYVAYRELSDSGGLPGYPYLTTVKKWNGSAWVVVGKADFAWSASVPSIAFHPIKRVPYVLMTGSDSKISVKSPLLVLGNTTSVNLAMSAGAVSLIAPASVTFPSATVSNALNTLNVAGGNVVVEDLKGAEAGYYVTVSASDLDDGNGHVIPKSNISANVAGWSVSLVSGAPNAAVSVPTSVGTIGEWYVPLSSATTLLQRGSSGSKLGKYSVNLALRIAIPAYTPSGNYQGTITVTLIEN